MSLFRLIENLFTTPTPKELGNSGEESLRKKLASLDFFGYHGRCLQNVYVPRRDGSTSEIDVIYITQKGLFVIESKNYSGYIFGNEQQKYWTSTLYAGKNWLGIKEVEKHRFYNPIRQNKGHLIALWKYCGNIKAFSIIAFGDDCELMDVSWKSENVEVCYYSELKKCIKDIWNNTPDLYDEETIDDIYQSLASLDKSSVTQAAHINNIKYGNSSNVCPSCGGTLVLRTAKNGRFAGNQFYGCSNYPRCKYIKNI